MKKNIFIALLFGFSLTTNSQTIEQVRDEINYCGLVHPEIVLAQTIKEAGWYYDSPNAVRRNNLLGLKGGKKCSSNEYGYTIFEHWTESICFYQEKIQNRYKEGEDYYDFLIRIKYFQADPKIYIADLKWIVRELERRGIIKH